MTVEDRPMPVRRPVVLTGISSRAWEHPADRGALTALRELRGFDDVLKAITGLWSERAWRLEFLGGAIKVSERQYPRLHQAFASAAATLDIPELPELYVAPDRTLNGMCIGMSKPFIVVHHGAVELLDEDEMRVLLGHELGHLMSGHAVYRTMIIILTRWITSMAWLPVGTLVLRGIVIALMEWWRKAELSADRAGLLATQDPNATLRLLMKLAGGGDLSQIDTTAFLEQAAEYDRSGDLRDSIIKLQRILGASHPLPVSRAAHIRRWIDSGEYGRIVGGEYPRRDDDRNARVTDDVKAAAASYRESFAQSEDPLVNLLRRFGDGTSDVGDWMGTGAGRIRDWMRGTGRGGSGSGGGEGAGGGSGTTTTTNGGTAPESNN
jgi:Zn-dependent protease with chaperone function